MVLKISQAVNSGQLADMSIFDVDKNAGATTQLIRAIVITVSSALESIANVSKSPASK